MKKIISDIKSNDMNKYKIEYLHLQKEKEIRLKKKLSKKYTIKKPSYWINYKNQVNYNKDNYKRKNLKSMTIIIKKPSEKKKEEKFLNNWEIYKMSKNIWFKNFRI